MYTYDRKNNEYLFDGNLEEYLLNIGVDSTHIKNMQSKILQADRDKYYDFPDFNSPEREYIKLVPLDKVIGTSRCSVGWSVFDNVRKMYDSDREPGGFESCFSYLNTMSLDELKHSYTELYYPVEMVYYVDDDEYYLQRDGNHRTLTAMLIGADKIKAKVINASLNPIKKSRCECVEIFENKYSIYRILAFENTYDIIFHSENVYYEVCDYLGPDSNEDLFAFVKRLSDTIDDEINTVNKIKKLPSFMQPLILNKLKNYRILSHFKKEPLSDDDLIIWNNRRIITLEELKI